MRYTYNALHILEYIWLCGHSNQPNQIESKRGEQDFTVSKTVYQNSGEQ
jgi:hypothetical protein